MSLLYRMLRKRAFLVFVTVCTSSLTVAVTLWWNSQLSRIINTVSAGVELPINAIIWALITMVVTGATNYASTYISGYTCERISHDLRMGYGRYFATLPFAEAENMNVGEQLSKLQNEIADVSGYINGNLFQLLNDVIRFSTTFIWLLFLNSVLTLTVYLPVLPIVIYIFYASRVIRSATERSQEAKGRMNGYAETMLALFPVIRLYDAASLLFNRYFKDVCLWERETVRAERTRARLMSPSGLFSTSLPLIMLFGVGGGMAINGIITIGTLYIYINLSDNVSGVLMNMPGYVAAFRQFSANIKRISPRILLDGSEVK